MNKTFKEVLLCTGIPLLLSLILCMTGESGMLAAGILVLLVSGAYFLIGLGLLLVENKHFSKVLLLSTGIILLVGFSTCGLILNGLRFN
ncbi:hypothetical protein [Chitinophaga sp.]|uniref:hypothetical protein n=1 Tax=Chitinophaga sp. TaxID=1869181 RepID=UPI002F93641C